MIDENGDSTGMIARFKAAYGQFSRASLPALSDLYAENVVFVDPVHEVNGKKALMQYFEGSVSNLRHCEFEFVDTMSSSDHAFVTWVMHFEHPKIASGEKVSVPGCSVIKFDDHVSFHRDYYDLGAMVYEHIPVLGWGVQALKRKIAGG